jgi:2-keto-3-deoxy-L-rhamnonate aldolase RhmA
MISDKDLNSAMDAFVLAEDIDVIIVTPEGLGDHLARKGDESSDAIVECVLHTLSQADKTESYPCLTCKAPDATDDDGDFGVLVVFGVGVKQTVSGLVCSDCLNSEESIHRFCGSLLRMLKKHSDRMAPAGTA